MNNYRIIREIIEQSTGVPMADQYDDVPLTMKELFSITELVFELGKAAGGAKYIHPTIEKLREKYAK